MENRVDHRDDATAVLQPATIRETFLAAAGGQRGLAREELSPARSDDRGVRGNDRSRYGRECACQAR